MQGGAFEEAVLVSPNWDREKAIQSVVDILIRYEGSWKKESCVALSSFLLAMQQNPDWGRVEISEYILNEMATKFVSSMSRLFNSKGNSSLRSRLLELVSSWGEALELKEEESANSWEAEPLTPLRRLADLRSKERVRDEDVQLFLTTFREKTLQRYK